MNIESNNKFSNLEPHAQLEIEHITMEMIYGRANHFRHFIDQFASYHYGFVSKSGNANTDLFFRKGFMTEKALSKFEDNIDKNEKNKFKALTKEHVTPLKVLTDNIIKIAKDCKVYNVGNIAPEEKVTFFKEEIIEYLEKNLFFCILDKEEDKKIPNSLIKFLPKNSTNPFDRYGSIDLEIIYVEFIYDHFGIDTKAQDFTPSDRFSTYRENFEELLEASKK